MVLAFVGYWWAAIVPRRSNHPLNHQHVVDSFLTHRLRRLLLPFNALGAIAMLAGFEGALKSPFTVHPLAPGDDDARNQCPYQNFKLPSLTSHCCAGRCC